MKPHPRHVPGLSWSTTSIGKLISTRIDYQISNAEELTPEAELILKVLLDGEPLEEISLLALSQLQPDSNTGSLNYIPTVTGWSAGLYTFQAELYEDEQSVDSPMQGQFRVTPEAITAVVSWQTLGVIIGATLVLVVIVVVLVLYLIFLVLF